MRRVSFGLLTGFCLVCFAPAEAAAFLKNEPAAGKLPAGETVLVDNGKCPKGQVQAVTGGGNRSLHSGSSTGGSKRSYKCVARP